MLINEPTSEKTFNETFPLRKSKGHAEVLLVGFIEIKEILENKIGYMCDEVNTEQEAVLVVKKALKSNEKPFYKYIIVDLDEGTINIERFGKTLNSLLKF